LLIVPAESTPGSSRRLLAAALAIAILALLTGPTSVSAREDAPDDGSAVAIPSGPGPGTPYPSTITVSGRTEPISDVDLVLTAFSHSFPDNVDVLLVGPTGANAIVMSDVGGGRITDDVNLTLDDSAAEPLPDNSALDSGTFRPSNYGEGDQFPEPAPPPGGGSSLSVFNGTDANGVWSLYVYDDLAVYGGDIESWDLQVTAGPEPPPPPPPPPPPSPPPPPGCDFSNSREIVILDSRSASPYPSSITVTGADSVTDLNVQLVGLSHTWPDDIDVLLVGPGGEDALIMSDAGGWTDATDVTVLLDDQAPDSLPDNDALATGTYRPANYEGWADTFWEPAPEPSGNVELATFNGTDPNGTWRLYVMDNAVVDEGQIAGGWRLCLNSPEPPPLPPGVQRPPKPVLRLHP
jgi:subtilisin-like proprotein convertase family protein